MKDHGDKSLWRTTLGRRRLRLDANLRSRGCHCEAVSRLGRFTLKEEMLEPCGYRIAGSLPFWVGTFWRRVANHHATSTDLRALKVVGVS